MPDISLHLISIAAFLTRPRQGSLSHAVTATCESLLECFVNLGLDKLMLVFAAEAVVQSLKSVKTLDKTYSIASTEGDGPGQDSKKWEDLLSALP